MNQSSTEIKNSETLFQGIPVSGGFAIGKVLKLDSTLRSIPDHLISESQVAQEITRLENAIIETRQEIIEIQDKIGKAIGNKNASIFNAHLLVLEDASVIEEVTRIIQNELKNAELVFSQVMKKFVKVFSAMEDDYLKERIVDIQDVTKRVLKNLDGKKESELKHLDEEVIIIGYDLPPSETAMMHNDKVIGFATDIGSKTSHTAIMARSLGVPAIVGLHDVSYKVESGMTVVLDGNLGHLICNPSVKTLEKYSDRKSQVADYECKLKALRELKPTLVDNVEIDLSANIEMVEDIQSVKEHGACGVGLYRTEFCYMNRKDLPSENDLTNIYTNIIKELPEEKVIIRTIDMGGDKFLSHLKLPEEMNPFLGWRAIRFCLERVDIFKTQLKAILRASAFGDIRVMYPMVSNLSEVKKANSILEECKKELRDQNISFNNNIPVGIMIEIPSAAIAADLFVDDVDFFSIGTNDLIQYTLAVDRINEKIAYLYQPFHPAVLRLIKNVVDIGVKFNIDVSVCGGMASDIPTAIILIGLGIKKLSMPAISVPRMKSAIRKLKYKDCKLLASNALDCRTSKQVEEKVLSKLIEYLPGFSTF